MTTAPNISQIASAASSTNIIIKQTKYDEIIDYDILTFAIIMLQKQCLKLFVCLFVLMVFNINMSLRTGQPRD